MPRRPPEERPRPAPRRAVDWSVCAQCGARLAVAYERWVLVHYQQPDGYPEWAPPNREFCSWRCLQQALGAPGDV